MHTGGPSSFGYLDFESVFNDSKFWSDFGTLKFAHQSAAVSTLSRIKVNIWANSNNKGCEELRGRLCEISKSTCATARACKMRMKRAYFVLKKYWMNSSNEDLSSHVVGGCSSELGFNHGGTFLLHREEDVSVIQQNMKPITLSCRCKGYCKSLRCTCLKQYLKCLGCLCNELTFRNGVDDIEGNDSTSVSQAQLQSVSSAVSNADAPQCPAENVFVTAEFGDVVTVAPETQINSGSSSESDRVSSAHSDCIEIAELDTILHATDYMKKRERLFVNYRIMNRVQYSESQIEPFRASQFRRNSSLKRISMNSYPF